MCPYILFFLFSFTCQETKITNKNNLAAIPNSETKLTLELKYIFFN